MLIDRSAARRFTVQPNDPKERILKVIEQAVVLLLLLVQPNDPKERILKVCSFPPAPPHPPSGST